MEKAKPPKRSLWARRRRHFRLQRYYSEIVVGSTCPLHGLITIVTDECTLRFLIGGDAAADLLIDLKQFLDQEIG